MKIIKILAGSWPWSYWCDAPVCVCMCVFFLPAPPPQDVEVCVGWGLCVCVCAHCTSVSSISGYLCGWRAYSMKNANEKQQ